MSTFVTKPREFQAVQVKAVEFADIQEGKGGLFDEMPFWLEDAYRDGGITVVDDQTNDYSAVKVKLQFGGMLTAHADDWIATDNGSWLYVIKAERFKEIVDI